MQENQVFLKADKVFYVWYLQQLCLSISTIKIQINFDSVGRKQKFGTEMSHVQK